MMEKISLFFEGNIICISILSWFIAQVIKVIIDCINARKITLAVILSSGGMPSSHSAFVCSAAACIGITEGVKSALFALSFILCMVVMYDAAGVRRAAGNQARVINKIIENVQKMGITVDDNLKEILGHSPIEVAMGALLGIILAFLLI